MGYRQLIINPGSTSTKLALYDGREKVVQENVEHDAAQMQQFDGIADQIPFRMGIIRDFMARNGIRGEELSAVMGRGGLFAHLGTSDCRVIERMIRDGDKHADLVFQAQAYQIAKGIGLLSIVLKGKCDAIILTGGVARSQMLTDRIKEYVSFIAPVAVLPGENEMEALAYGGLRILQKEENAQLYTIPQD